MRAAKGAYQRRGDWAVERFDVRPDARCSRGLDQGVAFMTTGGPASGWPRRFLPPCVVDGSEESISLR